MWFDTQHLKSISSSAGERKDSYMSQEKNKKIIVIGAGLGGLSAAISLAVKGYSISIYEKNEKVGGKLNVLKKDGFSLPPTRGVYRCS